MNLKAVISAVTATAMLVSAGGWKKADTALGANDNTMRDMTTMDIIEDMGIGINLGNTFESSGQWIDDWGDGTPNAYETAWGSPTVTKELIQGYANEGFGVVRVPVAWSNMMSDDGNYTIHPDYIARVKEVIGWALDADLYVIMNLHWDGGWLEEIPTNYDECMKKYSAIWTQLSDEFRDYGDYLMFESQNEELGWSSVWNQWGGTTGKDVSYGYVNAINQEFVDIVRSSGGNNEKRHLLISGYNTDITLTCDSLFKMPEDPAGRCAVSVHYYTPAGFAILTEDASWGKASSTWGTDAEYAELNSNMDKLVSRFTSKGVPVIIGEYGCPKENKEEASVRRFISAVAEASMSRGGICPVLWDVTDLHYSRKNYKMTDSELQKELIRIRDAYAPASVEGDINGDGNFLISDVAVLQMWLLNPSSTTLKQPEMADADNDGRVDIFDLCLLKNRLVS